MTAWSWRQRGHHGSLGDAAIQFGRVTFHLGFGPATGWSYAITLGPIYVEVHW